MKKKCEFECCNLKQSIIGECKWCERKFCLTHRLQEIHKCEKMDECKIMAFIKNSKSMTKVEPEKIKKI